MQEVDRLLGSQSEDDEQEQEELLLVYSSSLARALFFTSFFFFSLLANRNEIISFLLYFNSLNNFYLFIFHRDCANNGVKHKGH